METTTIYDLTSSIIESSELPTFALTNELDSVTFSSDIPHITKVTSLILSTTTKTITPPTETFPDLDPSLPSFVMFMPTLTSSTLIATESFPGITLEPTMVLSQAYGARDVDLGVWVGMVLCLLMVVHTWRFW
jgi:hypothetical protein